MFDGLAQEVSPLGQFDDICDHRMISGDCEITMWKEWKFFEDPSSPLTFLEFVPAIGIEESVVIRHVKVLADQSKDLGLCPEWIVTDYYGCEVFFDVHKLSRVVK